MQKLHDVIVGRVAVNLARIRKERKLSQAQMAGLLGIARPYLTQLESGTRSPSLEMVCGFAETLQTTVEQLIAVHS